MDTKTSVIHTRAIRMPNNVRESVPIEYPDNWQIICVMPSQSGIFLTVYFLES